MTPIYIKPRADTTWPEDSVFYMLTGSGLFLCRNNAFYQSAVPAPRWPTELAKHEAFLAMRYPRYRKRLLEHVVGYFERVADTHNTEAAVLLAWNKTRKRVQIVVPEQVATITRNGWGTVYPVGVEYEIPANLSPDLTIIGDIHSHVGFRGLRLLRGQARRNAPAGAARRGSGEFIKSLPSSTSRPLPTAFVSTVEPKLVLDGYERRCADVPDAWMDKITVEVYGKRYTTNYSHGSYGAQAISKNDGYGDYDKRSTDTADGGPHGNGQTCRKEQSYETGYDPVDGDDSPAADRKTGTQSRTRTSSRRRSARKSSTSSTWRSRCRKTRATRIARNRRLKRNGRSGPTTHRRWDTSNPARIDPGPAIQRRKMPMSGTKTAIPRDRRLLPELRDGQTIKIIGLGGVGSVVARYGSLFLAPLTDGKSARLVLVDGDLFEPSNATRMFFDDCGNKAVVTLDDLQPRFSETGLALIAIEEYVTPDNIKRLIRAGDIVLLCVDNHATRKLVSDYCGLLDDVVLISGGNDGIGNGVSGRVHNGTYGNCQVYIRQAGEDCSPSLTKYHVEIDEPDDDLPTDVDCVTKATSTPQLLLANLQAGSAILNALWLYLCGMSHYSELAFDIGEGLMKPLAIPMPRVTRPPVAEPAGAPLRPR